MNQQRPPMCVMEMESYLFNISFFSNVISFFRKERRRPSGGTDFHRFIGSTKQKSGVRWQQLRRSGKKLYDDIINPISIEKRMTGACHIMFYSEH